MTYNDFLSSNIPEITVDGKEVKFGKGMPASVTEIEDIQKKLNFPFSNALKKMYGLINGGEIFNYDNLCGFRIYKIQDLEQENKVAKSIYGEDWDNQILVIMEVIGEGNWIGIRTTETGEEIIDCFHETEPSTWQVIETSLLVFMENIFLSKGEKYWL